MELHKAKNRINIGFALMLIAAVVQWPLLHGSSAVDDPMKSIMLAASILFGCTFFAGAILNITTWLKFRRHRQTA